MFPSRSRLTIAGTLVVTASPADGGIRLSIMGCVMRRLGVWLGIITLICRAGQVTGQTEKPAGGQYTELPTAVAVFNFAGAPNAKEVPAWRTTLAPGADTYLILIRKDREQDQRLVETLRQGLTDDTLGRSARTHALRYIRSEYRPSKNYRGRLGIGAIVEIYAFHRFGTIELSHQETERQSRLASDLITLAKVVTTIPSATRTVSTSDPGRGIRTDTADTVTFDPGLRVQAKGIVLSRSRALVSITAALKAKPPAQATATAPSSWNRREPEPPTNSNQQSGDANSLMQVVTGSPEHFFFSANAGAADARSAQYDTDTRSLVPSSPSSFYIGANFAFTDLSTEPGSSVRPFYRGLFIGALVEASTRPADQLALIAGYRQNPIRALRDMISFETITPYVGALWVKSDFLSNGNVERRYRPATLIWGLSVNLQKAIDWLTPKKAEEPDKGGAEAPKG